MELTDGYALSLGLGLTFGVIYGVVSFLTYRLALRKSSRNFMVIAFGGMAIRLMAAVIAVTLVLVFAPVLPMVFVISFFSVFALALIVEVTVLHRQQAQRAFSGT